MAGYEEPLAVEEWPSFHFIQAFPPFSPVGDSGGAYQAVLGPTIDQLGVRFPTQSALPSGDYSCAYRLLAFVAPAALIIDRVVFQHSLGVSHSGAQIGILRFPAGSEAFGSTVAPLPWSRIVAGPSPIGDAGMLGIGTGLGTTGIVNPAGTYSITEPGFVYEMAITSNNYNQLDEGDGLYLFLNSPASTFIPDEANRVRVTIKGRFVAS